MCRVPGTGLTYARHALTANAAASVFVCSTLGNECSAPTQPTCRHRGQISGNVLLISVQPASRRGRGVYPGLALAAEVSLKVTDAVAIAAVAQ